VTETGAGAPDGAGAPPGWDDAAVRSPNGHVLQSAAWAKIREAQGWRPEFHQFGGVPAPLGAPTPALPVALVLWRSLPAGQSLAYVPRGPVAADRAQLEAALTKLAALARERRAIFLKVDPEVDTDFGADALRAAGLRRAPDIQPVIATLELDLAPEEDALFAALEKDTRWSVRQAEKRGVSIRDASGDEDLRALYDLYAETGHRAGFITRTWDYYRRMWGTLVAAGHAKVRLAEKDGKPVAGALTWRCGDREVYQSAATNDTGRSAYAAYGLLWRCIIEARKGGARRFDFGGIPVDLTRKDDPMYGPYLFKKGFGGATRRFVGAHDAVPNELAYRAYAVGEPIYTSALRLLGRVRS
jgi:peptidoglycan pentaglycine glycine transferase (the first glycine)